MSDVMLLGVLNMPAALWRDDPLDKLQRQSRYFQAATRIRSDADEITRLRAEVERLTKERGLPEMALGFAHAWCCSLLDQGIDPRQVEVPKLLEDWNNAQQKEEKK